MLHRIPGKSYHNLFSFREGGVTLPVTYKDLTMQMRQWLRKAGVQNTSAYSSHSLHRGGMTAVFENGVPEITIKTLGSWASNAYRRYIDTTLNSRLKAWIFQQLLKKYIISDPSWRKSNSSNDALVTKNISCKTSYR